MIDEMAKAGKAKPTKVELTPEAKAVIARLVPQLQTDRDDYQIGVGTIVAELIEKLADRPDLISELLGNDLPPPALKKASGKR